MPNPRKLFRNIIGIAGLLLSLAFIFWFYYLAIVNMWVGVTEGEIIYSYGSRHFHYVTYVYSLSNESLRWLAVFLSNLFAVMAVNLFLIIPVSMYSLNRLGLTHTMPSTRNTLMKYGLYCLAVSATLYVSLAVVAFVFI